MGHSSTRRTRVARAEKKDSLQDEVRKPIFPDAPVSLCQISSTPKTYFQAKLHQKIQHYDAPPPDKTPSVILKIRLLHKDIYTIGQRLPKRDKLGIHATLEKNCLELFAGTITAAFTRGKNKLGSLEAARVRSQVLTNLLRTEYELGVIKEKAYLHLSSSLVEISKMLNGWIAYQTQKESR